MQKLHKKILSDYTIKEIFSKKILKAPINLYGF